jgi:hypothetical protein
MDNIDHALGRPTDPMGETNRNFFGIETGGSDVDEFKADPYWVHTRDFMGTSGFAVSDAGKTALTRYLKEHWVPPKCFAVTWQGITATVAAKSAGAARYSIWMDCEWADYSFKDFLKESSVRVAV